MGLINPFDMMAQLFFSTITLLYTQFTHEGSIQLEKRHNGCFKKSGANYFPDKGGINESAFLPLWSEKDFKEVMLYNRWSHE